MNAARTRLPAFYLAVAVAFCPGSPSARADDPSAARRLDRTKADWEREVTIPLENGILNGIYLPGERVDVLLLPRKGEGGKEPGERVVLPDKLVIATDGFDPKVGRTGPAITVRLTAREAAAFAYLAKAGREGRLRPVLSSKTPFDTDPVIFKPSRQADLHRPTTSE